MTVLLCALALAACGSDDEPPRAATTAQEPAEQQPQPAPTVPGGTLQLPARVPRRATRDGDPQDIKVVRLWSEAMSRSQIDEATALWRVPAKAQNGTPLVRLATRADVRLFNDSLSCGAQLVSARGAPHGFTIAVFKLRKRPGADCGTGTGNDARTAILVIGGKIAEWYRLPDDPNAPATAPPPAAPAPTQTQEPEIPVA